MTVDELIANWRKDMAYAGDNKHFWLHIKDVAVLVDEIELLRAIVKQKEDFIQEFFRFKMYDEVQDMPEKG